MSGTKSEHASETPLRISLWKDSEYLKSESSPSYAVNNDSSDGSSWLDEEARKPFAVSPDVQDGFSNLCGACQCLFKRDISEMKHSEYNYLRHKHFQYFETLCDTSRRGCRLCAQVHSVVTRHANALNPAVILNLFCKSVWVAGGPSIRFYWRPSFKTSPRPPNYSRYGGLGNSIVTTYITVEMISATDTSGIIHDATQDQCDTNLSTWSPRNRELAIQWIAQCVADHTYCNRNTENEDWLPTRLLEIDRLQVRLVETCEITTKVRYTTLSHRWGCDPVFSLCKDNMALLKQGLPINQLPKTFRHSLEVTKHLGIEYIWIDSLCICQDSDDDWQMESSLMRNVYQNGFCNIAATASPNSHFGLFFEQEPALAWACRVKPHQSLAKIISEGFYFCRPGDFWEHNVSSAPLNRRAWVVQERLLSRRILHFGSQGLFFECCQLETCDVLAKQPIQSYRFRSDSFKNVHRWLPGEPGWDVSDNILVSWKAVVEAFMRSDLTRASDKIISLSGIAEEFQKHIIKEPYTAGLWKSQLALQLLWNVRDGRQTSGRPSLRPTPYRAPSWSWLSIDGEIDFPSYPFAQPNILIQITEVIVNLLQPNHPTGPIKDGHIVVRCRPLIPGVRNIQGSVRISDDSWLNRSILAIFDEESDHLEQGQPISCLPILFEEFPFHHLLHGLFLLPTGNNKTEFRRIGAFRFFLPNNALPDKTRKTLGLDNDDNDDQDSYITITIV